MNPPPETPRREESQAATSTREKLLDAALGVFAEHGFDNASVRDICSRAGTNVASVNYHFSSKRNLYDATIDRARALSNESNPWVQLDTERNFWADKPAEERLRLFVHMSIAHGFNPDGERSPLGRLFCHELVEPTPSFQRQFEISIERVCNAFRSICRDLMPDGTSDEAVRIAAMSIMAQCQYPALAHPSAQVLWSEFRLDAENQRVYAEHVYQFSLAGLRAHR